MNDIRSALTAAMSSRADSSNEGTEPIKSANDEQSAARAEQSEQDAHRPEEMGDKPSEAPARNDVAAIPGRGKGVGRSDPGQRKSDPVNREAPRTWKASDNEVLRTLPQSTQDLIVRQRRSIEMEFSKKNEALVAFHREYEPVAKIVEPFARRLGGLNLTPSAAIQRYIDIERRLATGEGVAVIKALVSGYRIPSDQVIEALGSKLSDMQLTPRPYPAQLSRQGRLNVTRDVNQSEDWKTADGREPAASAEMAAALRDFESQIDQFKTAQDTAGNPQHPYYADVEPEMAAMALTYSNRGQRIPSLKELYEKAVWTKPALRKTLVAAQHRLNESSRNAEPRPRTASARKTLSSLTNAPESKQAFTTRSFGRSLRDEILAHLDGT